MCWHFSLRGVAFFGASIHLCSGLIQMGSFLDTVMFLATNPKNNQTLESILVTLANLIYSGLRLPLSSLIFIGVEKESIGLLTWPPIAYFLLQVSGFMMRVKYGTMKMTLTKNGFPDAGLLGTAGTGSTGNGQIQWVKEDFVLPTNLEEFVQDTLFSFIFTSCHLLVLFFFVQKIETSVQGQVLDPSPGYSVTFYPHPIQPPPTPTSRLRILAGSPPSLSNRNQIHSQQPIYSESFRNLNYSFPPHNNTNSLQLDSQHLSQNHIQNQSQANQPPPPYQYDYEYHDGNSNIVSHPPIFEQQSSSPTIFPSSLHIQSIHNSAQQFLEANNNSDNHNHSFEQETDQELRMPLLPLSHSTSSSTASLANSHEHRITIISPAMPTPT